MGKSRLVLGGSLLGQVLTITVLQAVCWSVLSPGHKLEFPGKREFQLRDCLCQALSVGIFLVID